MIHVPVLLTRLEIIANINPRKHGFVTKTQTSLPANIKKNYSMLRMQIFCLEEMLQPLFAYLRIIYYSANSTCSIGVTWKTWNQCVIAGGMR